MGETLDDYLAGGGDVAAVVTAVADAGRQIARLLRRGPLTPDLAMQRGEGHGDVQKELDLRTDAIVMAALRSTPVAWLASEEQDAPVAMTPGAPLAIAIDPLDGSSNIETNAPMGTIFSVLPAQDGPASFLQPGSAQLAAGFAIYGAHTALVLTLGEGTRIFVLDGDEWIAAAEPARIAIAASEYAINGSNERHWEQPVRRFVDECRQGAHGPVGRDYNTRWLASLVAEAYRILGRGGVYLYPSDARAGYREGRLRLVYEANPVAWIVEEAGGAATDGHRRILDIVPRGIHQRIPLVFGAVEDVTRIAAYHAAPASHRRDPLFTNRTLFRDPAASDGVRA